MYKRPDGLYEKSITIKGERVVFRAKSEKEISKKILAYKGKVEKGRTFKEVAEEWKAEHFDKVTYGTAKSYKAPCKRLIAKFGACSIKDIEPNDINSFVVEFSKGGYSQKTVGNLLLVANLIFSSAVINRDISISPTVHVKVPKNLPKSKRDMPTEKDIAIVSNSVNCTFGLFAYFLLYTGCRKGEALALQYKDINHKDNTISITKSVYYISNKAEIKCPKTEAGNREIILLDKLAGVLPKGKAERYIFSDDTGNPIAANRFEVMWKMYCKEAGLSITPHQLRHGYATMLFEAGIDEKDAQELLGHASIAMTKDIYTHISKTRKSKTAELLNKFNS